MLHELSGHGAGDGDDLGGSETMNAQRGLAASWRDSTAEQDAGTTDSGFCTDPLLQSRPGSDGPDTRRAGKAA